MAYQDLTVTFHPIPNSGRYRVITHSPTIGQAAAEFVSPFGDERIRTWRHGLDPDELHMIGTLLYRRLFAPEICQAFQSAQRVAERQGLAVRLKLILDSGLAQLPWEYMYNPDTNQFLCLQERLALTRHYAGSPARTLIHFAPELNVLVLGVESDARQSRDEHLVSGVARTHRLEFAALESGAPIDQSFQILHVRAIGGRDPASGEYALQIKDGGSAHWLTTSKMARWLYSAPTVQLAVVDTLVDPEATTREASAFAAALVARQIVPAALTFQFPLTPILHQAFFKTFYRALSKQAGLDLAVTEGRQAIAAMDGASEWGAPVLYSSLNDDQPRPGIAGFEIQSALISATLPGEFQSAATNPASRE